MSANSLGGTIMFFPVRFATIRWGWTDDSSTRYYTHGRGLRDRNDVGRCHAETRPVYYVCMYRERRAENDPFGGKRGRIIACFMIAYNARARRRLTARKTNNKCKQKRGGKGEKRSLSVRRTRRVRLTLRVLNKNARTYVVLIVPRRFHGCPHT